MEGMEESKRLPLELVVCVVGRVGWAGVVALLDRADKYQGEV